MTAMDSRPDSRMRCRTASSSSPKRSASTTNTTRSASASADGGRAVHGAIERALLAEMQARRVDESDLHAGPIEHAEHAMARGLRARRDDGKLFADQRVEQRRLADVGAADERGETGAECGVESVMHIANARQRRLRRDLLGAAPARPFALGLERGMRARRRKPGRSAHAARRWCA